MGMYICRSKHLYIYSKYVTPDAALHFLELRPSESSLPHCANQAEFVEAQAAIKFALKVTPVSRVAPLGLSVLVSGANKRRSAEQDMKTHNP